MSAHTTHTPQTAEPLGRQLARRVLTRAVRGRTGQGTVWGEALLGEFEETTPGWETFRWTVSGLGLAWRERLAVRRTARAAAAPLTFRARFTRKVVLPVVLTVVALALCHWFVATIAVQPSTSMQPTMDVNSRLLVDKVAFRLTGIGYGDVVRYEHRPIRGSEQEVSFTKRVLGLPGDQMSCADGRLHRDGMPVDEPYLAPGTTTECAPVTVPAGRLYVLGDNRPVSQDSRQDGAIPRSAVTGRVLAQAGGDAREGHTGYRISGVGG